MDDLDFREPTLDEQMRETPAYCGDGACGRTTHGPHVTHPLVPPADENHWNDVECDQRPHCTVPAHHSIDG